MWASRLVPFWIKQRIPESIRSIFRSRRRSYIAPIYNIGKLPPQGYLNGSGQPKLALLSYVTAAFRLLPEDPCNLQFSMFGISRSIVRVLNELGYIVDLVEWTDTKFVPRKHYNLFIGHGGCNFKRIARHLSSDTVKIYFSSGIYWKDWNQKEERRFYWLRQRRRVRLPHDRWIQHSEEYANKSADGIICLGNEVAKESYSQFPFVVNLNNAAYPDDRYDRLKKDFASGRNKFFFFSGGGNVHKGLDLLLEVFAQVRDAHLYICQYITPSFYKVYRQELEDLANIHLIGPVSMRSHHFYEVIDKCNFVIHPSCAEGQPGSVVECMQQGLIPIVSRESNIDTDGFGVTLRSCAIDEIVRVVRDLSQYPVEWHEEMSRRTRKKAITEFSEEAFLRNMKNAIQKVIVQKSS